MKTYVFFINRDVEAASKGAPCVTGVTSSEIIMANNRGSFFELFCGLEETTLELSLDPRWETWKVLEIHENGEVKLFTIYDLAHAMKLVGYND